jgi:hypothetical protein
VAERERERAAAQAQVADLRAERDRFAAELAEARRPLLLRLLEAVRRR